MRKKSNTTQYLICGSVVTEGKDDKMAFKYLVNTRSWLMKKLDVSRKKVFYENKLAIFELKKTNPW